MTAPESARLPGGQPDLAEWVRRNGRSALLGAGVIAAVAVGGWLYVTSANRKEAFASQALMQARGEAESGNLPLAASDLTRLMDRFGGTKAADQAAIMLNQTRLVQGQRDVAINSLRSFVAGRHSGYVLASAFGLLGGALEDAGKYKEAADAFRQGSQNAELDFQKAQYLNDAARAFVAARDSASAKAAYAEVLAKFPRLDQAAEARVRMAELGGTVPPPPPPEDSSKTS
jgi:predicted negative regulator of RcsB-dependent stress response